MDIQKLLPSSKGIASSAIVKPKSTTLALATKQPNVSTGMESGGKLVVIKKKLIGVEDILKDTLASEKKKISDEKKTEQKEKRAKREDTMETKPKKKKEKDLMPSLPGKSFFGRIFDFFKNIIIGYFAVRLLEYAPLLLPIVKTIARVGEFILNVGGKILNGLVSFVDFGYKAYDATRGFVENIGGEEAAKKFDEFSGVLNKVLNVALIAAMAGVGPGGGGGGLGGGKRTGIQGLRGQAGRVTRGGTTATAARRYASRYGRDAAIQRFGKDAVSSLGGRFGRSQVTNLGRSALVKTLGGRGAAKTVKFAAGVLKPIVRNVPLIGGIIEFILSWISGDPIGKAAFKGVGAGLGTWAGGALGTLIGGPIGTGVGMWVGSQGGSALGELLYDAIFKDKKPKSETQGRSEGGVVRAKKTKSKESSNINLVQGQRSEPEVKIDLSVVENKTLKSIGEATKKFAEVDYFGPILASTSKLLLGQDLDDRDFRSVGIGINNLFLEGLLAGDLKGSVIKGFKEGGLVEGVAGGEADVTDWVTKSFKKQVEREVIQSEVATTVQKEEDKSKEKKKKKKKSLGPVDMLKKFLNVGLGLEQPESEDEGDSYSGGGGLQSATVSSGELELFQKLVAAESGGEGGLGMALVARSVLNRAGLIQSGKVGKGTFMANDSSITGVIYGSNQYQPVSDGSLNKPKTDAQMAQALEAIKTAQDVNKLKGMLKGEGYDESTIVKMLAATGFRTGSAFRDASQQVNVTKHGNHFFNTAGNEGMLVVGGTIAESKPQVALQEDIQSGTGKKLYLHWTAGGYDSTSGGYHAIVRGDGSILPKLNYNKSGEHTEGRNSNSVGLAVAAMREVPKGSGKYTDWPKKVQLEALAKESARIAKKWGWTKSDINLSKVMTHGEAASGKDGYLPTLREKPYNYGPKTWGGSGERWDLDQLSPGGKIGEGGPKIRSMIKARLAIGGETMGKPHIAMLGEQGKEFVLDADSYKSIEKSAPGFLDLLNRAEGDKAARLLEEYTSYNDPRGGETVIVNRTKLLKMVEPQQEKVVTKKVFVPVGGGFSETLDYCG